MEDRIGYLWSEKYTILIGKGLKLWAVFTELRFEIVQIEVIVTLVRHLLCSKHYNSYFTYINFSPQNKQLIWEYVLICRYYYHYPHFTYEKVGT